MRRLFLAFSLLLLGAGTPQAATLMQTIQKSNDGFAAAFNRGDAAAVAQHYTEQANLLPPGAELIQGRAGIEAFWKAAITSGLKNAKLTAISVEKHGPVLREIGRFGFDAPGQGGAITRIEGKYVVVWKRVGRAWMLDTDIWNMNK